MRDRYARRRLVASLVVVAVALGVAARLGAAPDFGGSDTAAAPTPTERRANLMARAPRASARRPSRTATAVRVRAAAPACGQRALAEARERNVYAATLTKELRPSLATVRPRVYVPNNGANTLTVLDAATGQRIAEYAVGAGPHHVTPSWNLRWLYVNNTSGNSLTVIDPRSGRVVRTIAVEDPYNLYFTPDGKYAIVVAERLNRLDFRNPQTWDLVGSVSIPTPGADHLDFSADGKTLYVGTEWGGYVYRIDVARRKITGEVAVGGLPVDVKLSPDGSVVYVTNQGRHGVSVIDARRLRELAFLPTGSGAHGLAVSRDAKVLYVSNRLAGSISVIAFATRKVVGTWRVGGSPDMLQVSRDGRTLWASNRYHGSVSMIDARTGRLRRVIATGSGAHGLAYFPQPGCFSVGHNGVYR